MKAKEKMVPSDQAGNKKAKKEQDYVEKLELEIRELKSINRSLMKQLKKLSKGIHKQEYEEALEQIVNEPKEETGRSCPQCGSKRLKQIEIAGRRFESCNICDYKSGKLK